jgi:hypothetical protein
MRFRPLGWLLLGASIVSACGGRYEKLPDEGDDAPGQAGSAPSSGATSSRGGATSRAGTTSRGGTASAGTNGRPGGTGGMFTMGGAVSVAGTPGSSGFAATGGAACACPAIACAPGYHPVPNPDGCCFHCEQDPLMQCGLQHAQYANYRAQVTEKYATLGCKVDSECGFYFDKNQCAGACPIPLPNEAIMPVTVQLNDYAQMQCLPGCPPEPIPPCLPTLPPRCVMNRCQ